MTSQQGTPAAAEPHDAEPVPHLAGGGFVVVRVGAAEYGLPVTSVREVIRTPTLSRVPFPPPDVIGVIGLRGSVIPVLDLGLRLSGRPTAPPGAVVVAVDPETQEPIGLLVDRVVTLLDASSGERREPPAEAEVSLPPGWVVSVHVPEPGRTVTMLDPRAVLTNPERRGNDEPAPRSPSDSEP